MPQPSYRVAFTTETTPVAVLKKDTPQAHLVLKEVSDEAPDPNKVFVMAEVYAPNIPDTDGEFMSADEIKKMAHDFIRKGRMAEVDVMHDQHAVKGVSVVESFIARDDDPLFIPGSWVVGVQVDEPELARKIRKGELNGFSMEAFVMKEPEQHVVLEIPLLTGKTEKSEDHEHDFSVTYDENGTFKGGYTNEVNGHRHMIRRSTATDVSAGHSHRFSHVDDIRLLLEGDA